MDTVTDPVVGQGQVHAPRAIWPQRAYGFEVGRFLIGEGCVRLQSIEFVVEALEDRLVGGIVRQRVFHPRRQSRDVAALLASLSQLRSNEQPFQ